MIELPSGVRLILNTGPAEYVLTQEDWKRLDEEDQQC